MSEYPWKPIEPLSDRERAIDLAATRPLYETWKSARQRLEQSSATGLREFNERLVRRLSIETGILERLYDLDRGTTEALIVQGFLEDLVSRSSTDIEPSKLKDILRDHDAASQLVMDCIAGNRPLTKGLIHELHAILANNEHFTTAVDQFGNRREIPLLKGQFKQLPNNPRRPDGNIHEYCPPEHVDREIENLLDWYGSYTADDPILVSAWLHHRFTQIHPFQDGNGRVARALTTLVLLRSELLPIVIDRDLRVEYISSLETADAGNLEPLASLFARLERSAIMQALSVDTDQSSTQQKSLTGAVIEHLAQKFERRREEKHAELRKVNAVALSLREIARSKLEQIFGSFASLAHFTEPQVRMLDGGPDQHNAHWYKFEVVHSANASGKFANFSENHYFVKATICVATERLVLVTSFHHVGRELTGVMEATSFARLESYEKSDDREYAAHEFFVCSVEPFVFTHRTNALEIADAFAKWLDAAVAVAIKEYGDRL